MKYIDSWVWLEYVLPGPHCKKAEAVLKLIEDGGKKAVFSSLGLTEVYCQVTRALGEKRAEEVCLAIESMPNLFVVPVNSEIAKKAAYYRAVKYSRNNLSTADAIHLATALVTNCDSFITGDFDFRQVKEIKVVLLR